MARICIDPGHGGTDPGATSNKIYEKNITLAISKKLSTLLKNQGFDVVMTRTADTSIDKYARCKTANDMKCDLFVSPHVNSNTGTPATGIETLIYAKGGNAEKCAKKVHAHVINATKAKDRGIKTRPELVVLNGTKMPAILIETGFINNSSDRNKLTTDSYQNTIASAIAKGICEYFGKEYKMAKTKFKDENKMSKWAIDSIKVASDAGVMNGDTNGNFRPKDTLTREEAAVIVAKLINMR